MCAIVGSKFGGTCREDPPGGGGFFKFAVKRALKQDQIVHMEGKLQVTYSLLQQGVSTNSSSPTHGLDIKQIQMS